jgi:hypothetical protein
VNVLVIALMIAAPASIWAAAYLLSLWREDRNSGTDGWPVSRIIAYLAIGSTVAASLLAALTGLRLADVPNYREIQLSLTPFSVTAVLYLMIVFTVLAVYLRAVRATGYMSPSERSGFATEASVQEAIVAAKAAYTEANHVNNKIADLTALVAGKEDKS